MAKLSTTLVILAYRVLLAVGPRTFRVEVGPELVRALEMRLALSAKSGGSGRVVRVGLLELVDLASCLVQEWGSDPLGVNGATQKTRMGGVVSMGQWTQDLKSGWRSIVRRPGFSLVVVMTLAIAIGGNSAVFGVVNSVLLRPLPYPDADELVYMNETYRITQTKSVAYPNYLDWRERNQAFSDVGARTWGSFTLTEDGAARELSAQLLSANVLDVLGVKPAIGRNFSAKEVDAHERVVVLSDGLWRTAFGADPDVLGRSITLTGEPYTILGVLPRDLQFPLEGAELWAPITTIWEPDLTNRRSHPGIAAIGRLASGVTVGAARADMDRVAQELAEEYPESNAEAGVNMRTLHEVVVGDARQTLILLQGAVLLVLLIACANIANLMLVRTMDRAREIALRVALGVGRARLARLVLMEGILLSALGGMLGLALAAGVLGVIRRIAPAGLPRIDELALDGPVLIFSMIIAIAAGTISSLIPAIHAARSAPAQVLKDTGARGGRRRSGIRSSLVISEVALAFMLLAGSGLMLRSISNLRATSAGLDPTGRVAVQVAIPMNEYPTAQERSTLYRAYLDKLEALPGVIQAGGVSPLPLSGAGRQWAISNDGFASVDENGLRVDHFTASPQYFSTMGIPLIAGRAFDASDEFGTRSVIVDETLAERLWPGEDALGRQLRLRGEGSPWMNVVGVVGHVQNYGVNSMSRGQMYTSYQAWVFSLWIVAETALEPTALVATMRDELGRIDPGIPIGRVATLAELSRDSIALERLATQTLLLFAAIALGLALLGLYGVTSYSVQSRTREIGIRMALGARAGKVVRRVLGEGVVLGGAGIVLGILGGAAAARTLSSLLFGVSDTDWVTYAGVAGLMLIMIGVASLMPALRATRVDPVTALRED